jgi:hypothetical protein
MSKMNKKAARVFNLYKAISGEHRQKWQVVNQRSHDFFLDNQLTAAEKKSLEDAGMPTFTINRIIPIIEMLTYYATANAPRWQAIGVDGSDAEIAAVHSDIMDYIWYESQGETLLSQVVQDSCTKSMGLFRVYVDSNADRGLGEVKIENLDPFDIYVDPKSRSMFFDDAAYIMIHKVLPKSHLMKIFPESKAKINKASSQSPMVNNFSSRAEGDDIQPIDIHNAFDVEGEDDPLIDYYEVYEKIKDPYVNVFYKTEPTEEQQEAIAQQIEVQMREFIAEMDVQQQEQELALKEQFEAGEMIEVRYGLERQKLQKKMTETLKTAKDEMTKSANEAVTQEGNQIISKAEYDILKEGELGKITQSAVEFYQAKIQVTCVIGDQLIYESFLPGEDYPIIPVHYRWTGTPYPISAVAPLVGKQQEINKSHQLMVHNTSLGGSQRYMYYEGSIDTKQWEQNAAAPGALLPIQHGYDPPTIISPQPLSSAFGQIVEGGKDDMEYLAGIYSSMQGDVASQHDTYKGLLAQDEYGTRRVKRWMKTSVEPALRRLGMVVKDYAQATYQINKVFRIVQPNDMQEDEMKEVEINQALYNDYTGDIEKFNDYASAQFDIRIVSGSTMPVNRWARLAEYKDLLQLGVVDDIAVLAETDISNKRKIAERKALISNLQAEVEKQAKEKEDLEGTIETLERQLVQAGIKTKILQEDHTMRKQVLDVGAKATLDAGRAKLDQDRTSIQMKDARINYQKDLARDLQIHSERLKSQQKEAKLAAKNGVKENK